MNPYKKIEEFKNALITCFEKRLMCMLLTGSYARGEERDTSDIDMWVFLDKVEYKDLNEIGKILLNLPKEPKLNPQCTSFEEALMPFFIREYSSIQYHTDGKILYGDLKVPYPKREEFLENSNKLIVYVLMGIRHFKCINESKESLFKKKLQKRILKPFMWALRYRCAATTGIYPLELDKLKEFSSSDEINAINIYKDFLIDKKDSYIGREEEILKSIYLLCEKLIQEN
ncbi:putative nucleotidyltransferase [Clostridium tetanomorphum]|uniref:Nucleotidyltransferase domain-containing protein n=1 Tax=Clostridium tetanomorphum TaxID=1553 RepID=A0A923E759_CLOTT|nr:nucleotidyltransferase domain-containing protein [Clostridium tetanomorphum]KAJ51782.1 hypothetical protein CTM_10958 [Clostridium tetanomorphum DSM 665]MBC2397663.1 nucleotidyltransferase domain-containing protein [Clostridium tetanomorphum]MBP1865017.1 putative nucleotidyltransferase [Clostridium tetanomorphum]NRS83386.1 putative nucleotidyltransferase [Clostridium tetanomorphum]NRZ96585.1 putative nucleotidyltransferase [Clostridium tetanomorphum]